MKKDKKIVELVPVEKQLNDEFKESVLQFLDEIRQAIVDSEISEVIILTKSDDMTSIIPMTNSLSSAVGMLELGKNELILSKFMEDFVED